MCPSVRACVGVYMYVCVQVCVGVLMHMCMCVDLEGHAYVYARI